MNILNFLEELNLDRKQIRDSDRWTIVCSYDIPEWIRASQLLMANLDCTHTIPGGTVYSIIDICDQYRRTESITKTQQLFIANNLIDHWNQMTCEQRAQIY
jgi:hypothetical protein